MKPHHLLLSLAGLLLVAAHSPASGQDSPRQDRKARRAAQAAAAQRTIDSSLVVRRFLFVPERVVTQLPGMPYVTLSSYYEVAVTPDSLVSSLPYYGYVYNTIIDPERSPFYFTALRPAIDVRSLPVGNKEGWVSIRCREQYGSRNFVIALEVFTGGSASLTIQGNGTQHLQFLGTVLPLRSGEAARINPEIK